MKEITTRSDWYSPARKAIEESFLDNVKTVCSTRFMDDFREDTMGFDVPKFKNGIRHAIHVREECLRYLYEIAGESLPLDHSQEMQG